MERFSIVLIHSQAILIDIPQIILSNRIILSGGFEQPVECFNIVLIHSQAILIHITQITAE